MFELEQVVVAVADKVAVGMAVDIEWVVADIEGRVAVVEVGLHIFHRWNNSIYCNHIHTEVASHKYGIPAVQVARKHLQDQI